MVVECLAAPVLSVRESAVTNIMGSQTTSTLSVIGLNFVPIDFTPSGAYLAFPNFSSS